MVLAMYALLWANKFEHSRTCPPDAAAQLGQTASSIFTGIDPVPVTEKVTAESASLNALVHSCVAADNWEGMYDPRFPSILKVYALYAFDCF
jgi:hypothetical protein